MLLLLIGFTVGANVGLVAAAFFFVAKREDSEFAEAAAWGAGYATALRHQKEDADYHAAISEAHPS